MDRYSRMAVVVVGLNVRLNVEKLSDYKLCYWNVDPPTLCQLRWARKVGALDCFAQAATLLHYNFPAVLQRY